MWHTFPKTGCKRLRLPGLWVEARIRTWWILVSKRLKKKDLLQYLPTINNNNTDRLIQRSKSLKRKYICSTKKKCVIGRTFLDQWHALDIILRAISGTSTHGSPSLAQQNKLYAKRAPNGQVWKLSDASDRPTVRTDESTYDRRKFCNRDCNFSSM